MSGWQRKIVAWGNSLAVRLPSQLFRKTNFKEGDIIEFHVEDDHTLKLTRVEKNESPLEKTETVSAEEQ